MDRTEADEVKAWFNAYSRTLRMEYGQAMALEGFDPNIIMNVQQRVAGSMVVWLERVS